MVRKKHDDSTYFKLTIPSYSIMLLGVTPFSVNYSYHRESISLSERRTLNLKPVSGLVQNFAIHQPET